MTRRRHWQCALLVALLVTSAACSGDDDAKSTDDAAATTTTAVQEEQPWAECRDPAGDATGGADLVKVRMDQDSGKLRLAYELGSDIVPGPEGTSWVVVATQGADPNARSYQLGFKMVNDQVSRFVLDPATGNRKDVDAPYTVEARRLVVSFPISDLSPLTGQFRWYAQTFVADQETDRCPVQGTTVFIL